MKAKVTNLPDEDHVMRYVSWARLRRDEVTTRSVFAEQAFQLKPDEELLSVNWLEYFGGDRDTKIRMSVKIFRETITVGTKSAFGIGHVCRNQRNLSYKWHQCAYCIRTDGWQSFTFWNKAFATRRSRSEGLAADAFAPVIQNTAIPRGRATAGCYSRLSANDKPRPQVEGQHRQVNQVDKECADDRHDD